MLLQQLYEFGLSRRLLDDEAFQKKNVRWLIPLDIHGNLIGSGLIETQGEKNKGKEYWAPRTNRSKVAGGVSEFLADTMPAIFGLEAEPEKHVGAKKEARDENNRRKQENFWRQIDEASKRIQKPELKALVHFHERFPGQVPFLNWETPDGKASEKPAWRVISASGEKVKLGNDQFSFQVEGRVLLEDEELKAYWREEFAKEKVAADTDSSLGTCLVTGETSVPIAATHLPKIKGVPGTQSFGAAIVSFDKDSFRSYGFDQSANAPVSTRAVAAYTQALNWILERDDHTLRIAGTAVCFWAKQQQETSGFFARMLTKPDPAVVKSFLQSPWAGIDRSLAKADRFYCVTFSGNAGRIMIRTWSQSSLEEAYDHLRAWFADLEMVSLAGPEDGADKKKRKKAGDEGAEKEKMPPLALFRLACTTVRDAKELKNSVLLQLYQAALAGDAPSLSLLKPILDRLKADLIKFGPKTLMQISRFALIKLLLNRRRKDGDPLMETALFETDDPAYNCGRLLAIFDDLQMAAHEWKLEGAGVVERYYGTASSAPNSAFGILWRLHQHHLKKVSRRGDKGRAAAEGIKRRIAEISCKFKPQGPNLPPMFPRVFNLQEQGRFALGFYQQKADSDARRREAKSNSQQTELKGKE